MIENADKIVISPLYCSKGVINNSKIVNEIPFMGDIIDVGAWKFKNLEEKSIITTVDFTSANGISFSRKLDSKDMDVMDCVSTIFLTGVKYFTLEQVCQVYHGNLSLRVTDKMKQSIKESIDRLMTTRVTIDCTEEFRARGLIRPDGKMRISGNLIYVKYITGDIVFSANGHEKKGTTIYQFCDDEAPVLYGYAKKVNQIIQLPLESFAVEKNTEIYVKISRYLLKRICTMKATNVSRKISLYRWDKDKKEYRGLLPYIGILKKDYLKENGDTTIWRNYKKRYADMCSEILNNMVERGIIKGFTPYYMKNERKNASELAGFEIEFEK